MGDVSKEGRVRELCYTNASFGEYGIPTRPMVFGSLVRRREARIPAQTAGLSLGSWAASVDLSEKNLVS